ncbi:MAG TPA: 6-phospho-3-hexuloisomerase [Armatimonadota bacterium]|nr:6-phospho-3-hexuloisomerase [Armatimonadota bacterium]
MSGVTKENALAISDEVRSAVSYTRGDELDALVDAIMEARRVFCTGQGRSGLVMRAFAMRLVHLGLNAHVVGETTTPAIGPGDLLVTTSGSGQTRTTFAIAEASSERGAGNAVLTAHPNSPVATMADIVVEVHAPITSDSDHGKSIQPPGSLFEQTALTLCDAMVMSLMGRLGTTEDEMRARHTKLE